MTEDTELVRLWYFLETVTIIYAEILKQQQQECTQEMSAFQIRGLNSEHSGIMIPVPRIPSAPCGHRIARQFFVGARTVTYAEYVGDLLGDGRSKQDDSVYTTMNYRVFG